MWLSQVRPPKSVRCDKREDLIFAVTIFGKSAAKVLFIMRYMVIPITSLEISDYLSVTIFRILRICTSQFAFFIKTLIFYSHDDIF